jgi:hypothetical protein
MPYWNRRPSSRLLEQDIILPFLLALLLAAPALAQQGRSETRLDDPGLANSADGIDLATKADGDLWVAMWTDERGASTSDDDVFISVSTDGGTYWRREQQVTDLASSSFDVDDAWLEVDDGTIYISFDDDSVTGQSTAKVLYSTDLGATWTTITYANDFDNPRIYADGPNLLVLFLDGARSPSPLFADTSSTGPAGLNAGPVATISNPGADADIDGWDVDLVGGVAHVAFFDDALLAADDDLYYVNADIAGAGAWSAPLLVNGPMDVDTRPVIGTAGSRIHFMWAADDVPGATSATDDIVFYRYYDLGGAFGPEVTLSSLADDVDYFDLGVEGQRLVMGWADDSTLDDQPRATWSLDGGATLTTAILPQAAVGSLDAQRFGAAARGEYLFVAAVDDSWTGGAADQWPTFWYSRDDGTTWEGPFILGTGFDPDEDIDVEDQSWVFTEQGIGAAFQSDAGSAGPDEMLYSSIAFPYVTWDYVPGSLTLEHIGNPVSQAGLFARWGVSTTAGSQVHPENPGLTVQLGPSAAYNITTSVPPVPPTTAVIGSDGNATLTLPAVLAPGTYYIQGWVNAGGLTASGKAGDLLRVTL